MLKREISYWSTNNQWIFFNLPNISSHTMDLEFAHSVTEMAPGVFLEDKVLVVCKVDNLTSIREPIFKKMCESRHLTTPWVSMACYRDKCCCL
jgi:hypothetical protein